jgi:hypothetical protein
MIVTPPSNVSIVDEEGFMRELFRDFTFKVSRLSLMSGSGSPEGVVEAEQLRMYMDTAGTASAIMYVKRDADIGGDKTQGWILI